MNFSWSQLKPSFPFLWTKTRLLIILICFDVIRIGHSAKEYTLTNCERYLTTDKSWHIVAMHSVQKSLNFCCAHENIFPLNFFFSEEKKLCIPTPLKFKLSFQIMVDFHFPWWYIYIAQIRTTWLCR